jgi:hypothetical protein
MKIHDVFKLAIKDKEFIKKCNDYDLAVEADDDFMISQSDCELWKELNICVGVVILKETAKKIKKEKRKIK